MEVLLLDRRAADDLEVELFGQSIELVGHARDDLLISVGAIQRLKDVNLCVGEHVPRGLDQLRRLPHHFVGGDMAKVDLADRIPPEGQHDVVDIGVKGPRREHVPHPGVLFRLGIYIFRVLTDTNWKRDYFKKQSFVIRIHCYFQNRYWFLLI